MENSKYHLKQEWCEHLKPYAHKTVFTFEGEMWKFCPICGVERPKEKSKEEKLALELRTVYELEHAEDNSIKDVWDAVARAAMEFLEKNK